MKKLINTILLTTVMACAIAVAEAQPVHSFSVKIGIDCESVDSLGGRERVEYLIKDMFRKVNKAFN